MKEKEKKSKKKKRRKEKRKGIVNIARYARRQLKAILNVPDGAYGRGANCQSKTLHKTDTNKVARVCVTLAPLLP
jgi:hypothetical protein